MPLAKTQRKAPAARRRPRHSARAMDKPQACPATRAPRLFLNGSSRVAHEAASEAIGHHSVARRKRAIPGSQGADQQTDDKVPAGVALEPEVREADISHPRVRVDQR